MFFVVLKSIHRSVDSSEALSVAESLLQAGANINAADKRGRTPLHLAVNANSGTANSSSEMEQFLLDKGANAFARDHLQRLPLHYVFIKFGRLGMDSNASISVIEPLVFIFKLYCFITYQVCLKMYKEML